MKNRLFAIILAAVFVVCALTGCAASKVDDSGINSAKEAQEAVVQHFGFVKEDCTFNKTELENGRYEVELTYHDVEYEALVMISTGEVVEVETDGAYQYGDGAAAGTPSDTTSLVNTMTEEEAKSIAFAHLGLNADECTVTAIEFENGVYEIEFVCNGKEYDVEVHSKSGSVTEIDVD